MSDVASEFHGELDAHIAESMKDPEYAAAYRAAEERTKRLVQSAVCSEGNCVVLTDPEDPDYEAGWGPVDCPCQEVDRG